ncbi:MAG: preprotein translocase subunit SecG [Clostridia bacterium]|nr:preprotein translocase subunit SecG [Clostridia bacterium]
MLNFVNLLAEGAIDSNLDTLRITLSVIMIVLMAVAALAAIVLVLLQPSNSNGVSALGGSSETFFGKNKGKSIEAKMKKLTIICLVVLALLSIAFFVLQIDAIWVRA